MTDAQGSASAKARVKAINPHFIVRDVVTAAEPAQNLDPKPNFPLC
jgi:hypothetical protein